MITFDEALHIIKGLTPSLRKEQLDFRDTLFRVLAEDIFADADMPPFDKSAMDGYACRKEDLHAPMLVVGNIPAGKISRYTLAAGECMRIMTGAPVPAGADCVIMMEHTEPLEDDRIRYLLPSTADNICYQGEDVRKGALLLREGARILPQHIAVLASAGIVKPWVYCPPVVGILSSGDELVEPEQRPGPSQIRNSNAFQIEAQVRATGAIPKYLGIIPDEEEASHKMIGRALESSDILLITGGVSTGDMDLIPKALERLGVTLRFDSLAVQPGRPTVFGTWKEKYVFGLPGNPVSSFVQYELLVKSLIYRMMGHDYEPATPGIRLATGLERKKANRQSFLPVSIGEDGMMRPVAYHGSAHIHAYLDAHALLSLEIGQFGIKEGEIKRVRPL